MTDSIRSSPSKGSHSPGHEWTGGEVPVRALVLSLGALAAAGTVSLLWPSSISEYNGLIWVLALVPIHLLSYYRGWRGAVLATTLAMIAFVASQLVSVTWLGQQLDWWIYGAFVVGLTVVSLGTGSLAEGLLRSRERALELAYLDPLTKLANRRLLRDEGEEALAAADDSGESVGLVFLDLVRFKRINDSMGHLAGDRLLRTVGRRLKEHVREVDVPARVGGDEFAVLLTELDGEEDALAVTRRLKEVFHPPVDLEGQEVHVEARVGVALYPDHAEDFDQLLSHATATQHQLKLRSERDVAVYKTASTQSTPGNSLELEEDLLQALREERLALRYQPIFSPRGTRPVAVESLAVWHHHEHGYLPASTFIPLAIQAGFIRELDRQVLRLAVGQASRWHQDRTVQHVSVNLSPGSLADPELPGLIEELLAEFRLPGRFLALEITEQVAMRNPEDTAAVLAQLEALDVLVALDDFGTGYSSFSHLSRFPIHWLKVDQSLMTDVEDNRKNQRMMEGIIALGYGLDLKVVVEGVETSAQLEWLRETRCDYVQGYHLARPGPADSIAQAAFTREPA